MAKIKGKSKICSVCKKEQSVTQFYKSKNIMFVDGYVSICKKCLKKMINYDDMNTIYNVLRTFDIVFDYEKWNQCEFKKKRMNQQGKNYNVFGNYMRQVNALKQFEGKTWKDSVFKKDNKDNVINNENNQSNNNEQKKIYSKKWRGEYTKEEIEYLDDYLKGTQEDFNVVTKNHIDYAKKIAKASLAMDNAYDDMINNVQGADKRYKDLKDAFDSLSKSAQFSENTRSGTSAGINGISEIVDKVESKEWIDEVNVEEFPEDALDHLMKQFSNIEKSL